MRKTVATPLCIVGMLVGCSYNAPERTFQGFGITCSESGEKLEISDQLIGKGFDFSKFNVPMRNIGDLKNSEGKFAGLDTSKQIITELMDHCRKFLDRKGSTQQAN